MNLPNMDWKPILNQISGISQLTCPTINHPDYVIPYGQTIDSDLMEDNNYFYCLNRGDTNPFLITNSERNVTWTQYVNKKCDGPNPDKKKNRRCLGLRPDMCIFATCKYRLLRMIQHSYKQKL